MNWCYVTTIFSGGRFYNRLIRLIWLEIAVEYYIRRLTSTSNLIIKLWIQLNHLELKNQSHSCIERLRLWLRRIEFNQIDLIALNLNASNHYCKRVNWTLKWGESWKVGLSGEWSIKASSESIQWLILASTNVQHFFPSEKGPFMCLILNQQTVINYA